MITVPVSQRVFPVLLILMFLVPSLASGQPASSANGPQVRATIDPDQLTVGSLATYTIAVESPPHLQPSPPALNQFEGFELEDQGANTKPSSNGKKVQEFWYRLRADRVGYHTLKGPEIVFQSTDGSAAPSPITAPDAKVQIRSVLYKDGQPEDIRDIKPIFGAAFPWEQYFWPIAGGLLLAFLMGYLAKRWAEKRQATAPPAETQVSPQELALRELQGLYDKGLLKQGRYREHYFELSEIFRRYIGLRYSIPALDWTTEEIARHLGRNRAMTADHLEQARHLLQVTDLIKFAKAPVEEATAIDHMKGIRDFIKATAVQDKAPEVEQKVKQEEPVVS